MWGLLLVIFGSEQHIQRSKLIKNSRKNRNLRAEIFKFTVFLFCGIPNFLSETLMKTKPDANDNVFDTHCLELMKPAYITKHYENSGIWYLRLTHV